MTRPDPADLPDLAGPPGLPGLPEQPGQRAPSEPGARASPAVVVRRAARGLLDLVLPVSCIGCDAAGTVLCRRCVPAWSGPPRRCEHGAARLDRLDGTVLPVWALAENVGPARRAVVAWKDRGRADATATFARLLGDATRSLCPDPRAHPSGAAGSSGAGWSGAGPLGATPVVVVPVPSSRRGRAERGEDLVARLARACAAHGPPGSVAVPALRLAGRGRDQVGLGVRGRAENLAGRVRVRPRRAASVQAAPVLLVDDVLTTGATLAACRAAVESVGGRPVGALVLAVTRPPGAATAWLVEEPEAG